jgi:hypothetical protein
MVAFYLPKEMAEDCENKLLAVGLPTLGFKPESGEKPTDPSQACATAKMAFEAIEESFQTQTQIRAGEEIREYERTSGIFGFVFGRTKEKVRQVGNFSDQKNAQRRRRINIGIAIAIAVLLGSAVVWGIAKMLIPKRQTLNSSTQELIQITQDGRDRGLRELERKKRGATIQQAEIIDQMIVKWKSGTQDCIDALNKGEYNRYHESLKNETNIFDIAGSDKVFDSEEIQAFKFSNCSVVVPVQGIPPAQVSPEPTSIGLMGFAMLLLRRRQNRPPAH